MTDMTPPGPPTGPPSPSPPPQAPTGLVRLTLQGSVLTTNLLGPRVRVNGYPIAAKYGVNLVPVHAGPTHLDVDLQWMRTYGQAAIDVQVAPGETVQIWYAAPLHQFARGRMGFSKQKRPGLVLFVALMLVVGMLAALVTAVAIINS